MPPANWQLPPGVSQQLRDYTQSSDIARNYDASIAQSPWATIDIAFADRHFAKPGRLIDLGCGTGRALVHFAQKGFQVLGVDLSEEMLSCARKKAPGMDLVKGNIAELSWLDASTFDYAVCLFSTLGMIAGAENRGRFLRHVQRILKPGGMLVVHVHNRWRSLWTASGRSWLLRDAFRGFSGDHDSPAHEGLAGLRLHLFTRREIARSLREAGFRIAEVMPLGLKGSLIAPIWFGTLRAYGYLVAAERTP